METRSEYDQWYDVCDNLCNEHKITKNHLEAIVSYCFMRRRDSPDYTALLEMPMKELQKAIRRNKGKTTEELMRLQYARSVGNGIRDDFEDGRNN